MCDEKEGNPLGDDRNAARRGLCEEGARVDFREPTALEERTIMR